MATVPALNLTELLKGVPRGAWVALSSDGDKLLGYGSDMRSVLEEAKKSGDKDPIITRVPECAGALVL